MDKSVSPRSFLVLLLGGFAVFALVLASLGIYALISYSVSQRTQEITVRSADSLLFGVTPRDPGTFAGMLVVLTSVALVAGYLPARRASRVDPMVALRTE